MESQNLPILLEEVLSGRPEDPRSYKESSEKLHKLLKSSPSSSIQAASRISSSMLESNHLSQADHTLFTSYLSKIKQSSSLPSLTHLTKINSGLKVAALFHALHKIQIKSQSVKQGAFISLKISASSSVKDLEIKRLHCARLISGIKANLGFSMEKTLENWSKFRPQAPKIRRKNTLTLFQRQEKRLTSVKSLLMYSPLAFEQQAFWRWRLVVQEIKQYEERLKSATEMANWLRQRMLKKISIRKLKDFCVPPWVRRKDLLWTVLRRSELRIFFEKKLAFATLLGDNMYEEYEEEEEEHRKKIVRVVKTRSDREPKDEINDKDLRDLINKMTENQMVLTDKQQRIAQLVRASLVRIRNKTKFAALVELMKKINGQKSGLAAKTLNRWQVKAERKVAWNARCGEALASLKNLIRPCFTKIIFSLPEYSLLVKEEKRIEEFVEYRQVQQNPEMFEILASKAILFSNSAKFALLRWKNKSLAKILDRIPSDSNDAYKKASIALVFKIFNMRIGQVFRTWVIKNDSQIHIDKKIRVESFISMLNSALTKNTKSCFQMPKSQKPNDEILSNAIVALCKNLLWAKTKVFNTWFQYISRKNIKGKVEEYLLRNLAKYPKMVLIQFFTRWRQVKQNNSRQLFAMISVIHRIFASKGKRVFNPPRIIKDADQIMRRCIRKLTHVKDWALRIGLLRWKYFKIIESGNEKKKSVAKAMHMLANPTKYAFSRWKNNISTKKCVYRADGTAKLVFAVNKLFRARFKLLTFKALISNKRMTILKHVWREFNQKYSENTRLGFYRWKDFKQGNDLVDYENNKSSLVIGIVYKLNKRLANSFKSWRDFNEKCNKQLLLDNYRVAQMRNLLSKPLRRLLKPIIHLGASENKTQNLLRKLFGSFEFKLRDSLFIWKNTSKLCEKKAVLDNMKQSRLKEILKLLSKSGLKTASEKILGHGSRVKGSMALVIEKLKFRPKNAMNLWKNFSNEVKNKKRFTQATSAALKKIMVKMLLRRLLDTEKRILGGGDKVKGALKSVVGVLKKKSKITFTKWTKYVTLVKTKEILDNAKSNELKFVLNKVVKRTLKDSFSRVVGDGNKTKGSIRCIIGKIKKRPRKALLKWLKFASDCDKKILVDRVKSERLNNCLQKIPKRTMRDAFSRVAGKGNKAAEALKTFALTLEKRILFSFEFWKKVVLQAKEKKLLDDVEGRNLAIALRKLPLRTFREIFVKISGKNGVLGQKEKAKIFVLHLMNLPRKVFRTSCDRFLGDRDKTKRLISRIFYLIGQRSRFALVRWIKFVGEVKEEKLLDNIKSQKLLNALNRVPKKRMRDSFNRIIGDGNVAKGIITRALSNILKKPKNAIAIWLKYSQDIDKKGLMDNLKSQKLKNSMQNIIRRTIRDTQQRIVGGGDKIKGQLTNIVEALKKKPRNALNLWKNHINDIKTKKALDAAKSQQLKSALSKVPRRTLKDATQRILGDGNKVKGVIVGMFNQVRRKPKDAIQKWVNYAKEIDKKGFLDMIKSQKLKSALAGIPKRTLRDGFQRIIGNGDKVKAAINSLQGKIKKRQHQAYNKWLKFLDDIKTKKIYDNFRSEKLKNSLLGLPRRTIKDTFERIQGDGNKVKGALKSILNAYKRKPKEAYTLWKNFVENCKHKGLFDNLRSQKLKQCLDRIPRRIMRDSLQRILGDGSKVKGAIKNILSSVMRRPRDAINKWKQYMADLKSKKIFDMVTAHKLKNLFEKVLRRPTKDTVDRLIGEGDKVKGALKSIINSFKKLTANAFWKWKKAVDNIKSKNILDNVRSQKLKNALTKIPTRTLRDGFERIIGDGSKVKGAMHSILNKLKQKPRMAYNAWKDFLNSCKTKSIMDNLRSQKLKSSLTRIPLRTLKDSSQRIIGSGDKAVGLLKSLFMAIEKLPKRAFLIWKDFIKDTKNKNLLNNLRSSNLKSFLFSIPLRTLRSVVSDLVPDKSKEQATEKLKALVIKDSLSKPARRVLRSAKTHVDHDNAKLKLALKVLGENVLRLHNDTFRKWLLNSKNDSQRCMRAHNLLASLSKILLPKLRKTVNSIIEKDDKVKNAIGRIVFIIKQRPKLAFLKWNRFVILCKTNQLVDNIKSQKLLNALQKVPKRTMRDSYNRIIGDGNLAKGLITRAIGRILRRPKNAIFRWVKYSQDIDKKGLMDNLKSQKLKNSMQNIIRRTIRDTQQRIVGGGDKIKGQLTNIVEALKKKPRNALNLWKNHINDIKTKKALDAAKSQQLKSALSKVPRRTLKDATQRILGDGNKVKGVIVGMFNQVRRKPKDAIQKWVNYAKEIDKKGFLDMIKSQKLKSALAGIPKRTLRDGFQRIIGNGDKVKAAINSLQGKIQKRQNQAYQKWLKFLADVKAKKIYDNLRSEKLRNALLGLPRRTVKDSFERIQGDGNKVKGALKSILNAYKRKPKEAYTLWKNFVENCKHKGLFDNLRSQKLKQCLDRIPRRIMRDSLQRILGDGSKVKGAIKNILSSVMRRPRDAINKWKQYMADLKSKKIFDMVTAHKLKNLFEKVLRRPTKDTVDRLIGEGDKVKGALKSIINSLKKLTANAFWKWKKAVDNIKSKNILDNVRSQKLKNALTKIPNRTLRDGFERIIGDGSKVKGAIHSILNKLKQKPRQAYNAWKDFVNSCKTKSIMDNLRSQKLKSSLTRIPLRMLKDSSQRIIGSGDKAVGLLKSLFMAIEKLPRRAFLIWKDFIKDTKTKHLLSSLRSEKLKSALTKLPSRTLRSIFDSLTPSRALLKRAIRGLCLIFDSKLKASIQAWLDWISSNKANSQQKKIKAMVIKESLSKPSRRVLRSTKSHVDHDNSKLRLALKILGGNCAKLCKDSFTKWRLNSNPSNLEKSFKAQSLNNSLSKLLTRSLRQVVYKMTTNSPITRKKFAILAIIARNSTREPFSIWTNLVFNEKKNEIYKNLLGHRLQKALNKIALHTMKDSVLRVLGEGDKVKGALKQFADMFYKKLRQAYSKWNRFNQMCNSKELVDSRRIERLCNVLKRIGARTARSIVTRVVGGGNQAKGKLTSIFRALEKLPLMAFAKWKQYLNNVKSKNLFDEVRAYRLKSALSRVSSRTLSQVVNKFAPASRALIKQALKDLMRAAGKKQVEGFTKWKQFVSDFNSNLLKLRIKGLKLKDLMTSASQTKLKSTYTRVVGGGSLVRGVFSRMASKWSSLLKSSFKTYHNNSKIRSSAQMAQASKLRFLSSNILKTRLKQVFVLFFFDGRILRLLRKMFGNYSDMQKHAFKEMWNRVEKWRTIHKINSAYFVFRQLLSYAKRVQEVRFGYWKNLEFLRKRRMMRKATTQMMRTVSINYEGALWRWKTIITKTNYHVTPKHSLAFKRFILSGTNYQKRLVQFSFYKISLYFRAMLSGGKLSLPQAIAHMNKHSRDLSSADNPLASLLDPIIKSVENPSISTATTNKMSKEEVNSMNQLGALELFTIQVKSAKNRKLAWALASVFTYSKQIIYYDSERSRLIEQINELRFEKHSLLEDNNTLRLHNENLIENLEKSNMEFQALSLNLDNMRLVRMVRVVSKMIEVPMAEAFLILYDYQ